MRHARSIVILASLPTSFASLSGCATMGHQVVVGPGFSQAGKTASRLRTIKKESCAGFLFPLFNMFGVYSTGPFADGDASAGTVMKKIVGELREKTKKDNERGIYWKLAYLTLDRRLENYLIYGRICTVVRAVFVEDESKGESGEVDGGDAVDEKVEPEKNEGGSTTPARPAPARPAPGKAPKPVKPPETRKPSATSMPARPARP